MAVFERLVGNLEKVACMRSPVAVFLRRAVVDLFLADQEIVCLSLLEAVFRFSVVLEAWGDEKAQHAVRLNENFRLFPGLLINHHIKRRFGVNGLSLRVGGFPVNALKVSGKWGTLLPRLTCWMLLSLFASLSKLT